MGAIDAIHKAMTHPEAKVVQLTEKQFLWGLRFVNFKRKIPTGKELKEQQLYRQAGGGLVENLKTFLVFASAVYKQSIVEVQTELTDDSRTRQFVVTGTPQLTNSLHVPAHFIATCHDGDSKICVVAIRGAAEIRTAITHSLGDVSEVSPELPYRVHALMVEAATALVEELKDALRGYYQEGYKIVTTGHSLGGGVAALAAVIMRAQNIAAEAFTFGTPACVELALAQSCATYVTTVVCGDDLVPRLSAYNTAELSHRLATLPWRRILLTEAAWWDDMVRREQLEEREKADLVKELCMVSDAKLVEESFTDWLRGNSKEMLHLVPPGRICFLARSAEMVTVVPLLLQAHDLIMVRDSPMCLQVSEQCVPHHCVDKHSEALDQIEAVVPHPPPKTIPAAKRASGCVSACGGGDESETSVSCIPS